VLDKLHHFTGLPVAYLDKADLRVTAGEFAKTLQDDADLTTGWLDSRFSGPTMDPLGETAGYDPQAAAISSAYLSAYNDYARKQLGVTAADPKYDKRTGVADDCRTDSVGQLIGILVCECEVRGELACLRQQGRECVRAEGLELIHVHEKRYAIRRWKGATSHSNKLKVRHQERPEQIRCLLPIAPLARLATRMRRLSIVNLRSRRGAT